MKAIENNLEFLEMLGYDVELIYDEQYMISDENAMYVGELENKRLYSKKRRKSTPGYEIDVNSDLITYKNKIRLNDNSTWNTFNFKVKRGESEDNIRLVNGVFPSLSVISEEFGDMNFYINQDKMYLNFKSKTENKNIEETIILEWRSNNESNSFTHTISYCDIDKCIINSQGVISVELLASTVCNNDESLVNSETSCWVNGRLDERNNSMSFGNIEQVIEDEEIAIQSVNHFRLLLSKLLPTATDILSFLLKNCTLSQKELGLLLPDIVAAKNKEKDVKLLALTS